MFGVFLTRFVLAAYKFLYKKSKFTYTRQVENEIKSLFCELFCNIMVFGYEFISKVIHSHDANLD